MVNEFKIGDKVKADKSDEGVIRKIENGLIYFEVTTTPILLCFPPQYLTKIGE